MEFRNGRLESNNLKTNEIKTGMTIWNAWSYLLVFARGTGHDLFNNLVGDFCDFSEFFLQPQHFLVFVIERLQKCGETIETLLSISLHRSVEVFQELLKTAAQTLAQVIVELIIL